MAWFLHDKFAMSTPKLEPPKTYRDFRHRFPKLGEAWDQAREAGEAGPLDERTRLLIKLALSIGALREGAVHSAARRASEAGVDPAAINQVIALAATTVGFPATVAAFSWVRDTIDGKDKT